MDMKDGQELSPGLDKSDEDDGTPKVEMVNEDEIHDFNEIYDHRASAKERTAS